MKWQNLYLSSFIIPLLITACEGQAPDKTSVENQSKLTVAVNTAPDSLDLPDGRIRGFEYDLLKLFAEHAGKELRIIKANTASQTLSLLEKKEVSLAVGSLVLPESKKDTFSTGPIYTTITQVIAYRYTETPPDSLSEVIMRNIHVGENPAHLETLAKIKRENDDPTLWTLDQNLTPEDLLSLINQGFIDYAVVDSKEISLLKLYYPNVKEAFPISEALPISWIFDSNNQTLATEVNHFFKEIKRTRELDNILDRYYGHIRHLNYPQKLTLMKKHDEHLKKYRSIFKEIGSAYETDWKLIAAISYQESRWDSKALSVSGVKGLMMVTQKVTEQFQLPARHDPVQNVLAGVKYLLSLKQRLPQEINEPDRTWMALVAYNVGINRLNKFIKQVQDTKQRPILWVDIADALKVSDVPDAIEHKHTYDPVNYVYNIRAYYDLIVWLDSCMAR